MLSQSQFLAQVIMVSASLLGWLLDSGFQGAFKATAKSTLARSIPLDIEDAVLRSVKFDLLKTYL
jgi:hypothetical protein